MLYTTRNNNFRQNVHPSLQKRLRIFLIMGGIMFVVVAWDIVSGVLSVPFAGAAIVVGGVVGWFTSRIFHLSWNHDGQRVVGRIDTIGWIVLATYIAFEIARAVLFETVIHLGAATTAITFAFVSSALISRMFGLRGRIIQILKEERVFG